MELVLFVGLQASGKSGFYRERFAATHALVSKDLLRHARDRELRQRQLVAEALSAGRSVVVDNTNPRAADRAPLVALGRAAGARVVAYAFDSSLQECLARNAGREGRARVPKAALFVTVRKLEWPSPAEGFDAVYSVRVEPPPGFRVEEWQGPRQRATAP